MCGIAGHAGPSRVDAFKIRSTLASLQHRGPDGEGVFEHHDGHAAVLLIHRRLAIIDLDSRADQPFRFDDGVLAFNGEIYNYVELRRELAQLGHRFKTTSDTEVLAHALREWGAAALERCEGMWAFAWYDERSGELLLCRDRFGEKPLYLLRRGADLYFGSETRTLGALVGDSLQVNEQQVLRYLVNGYKSLYKQRETFFSGVEELPPGTLLRVARDGKSSTHAYWSRRVDIDESLSYEDCVHSVRSALIEAVGLRLRSDVPLAFCMSGGIDSNSLISIARHEFGCDVHGFTIVNTDARYEEMELVDAAVKSQGLRHTAVPLSSANFVEQLTELIAAHDAPIYTISYYVHWRLMRSIAAAGYKVAFSGTGADELFTGYYDHHNLYLAEIAALPELHAQSTAAWREHVAGDVRNPHLQDPDLYRREPDFRGHIYLNNDEFASWLRRPWREDFFEQRLHASLLRSRMMNELFEEAVPVILHEDDLNAMYFSIENRSPFLDRGLYEAAGRTPSRYLIRDGKAKAVLRDAMRGIVPAPILDSRRKVGFNAPILELLDTTDQTVRSAVLDDSPIYRIVRKDAIENLLRQTNLPNSYSKFLFSFVCAKIFLAQHEAAST